MKQKQNLLILGLYLALALLMTWPTAARLSTHLLGGRDDLWIHQWTFWWVKEALRTGQNPFFTPLLYHPHGVSLTSHNIAWFNIVLWLPLQALVGHIAAYNLIAISVFALNGWTMFLFAAEETGSRLAAFVAGLIYAFWPYTLSHYDHTNMMVVFGVPLVLLEIKRSAVSGQRSAVVGLALAITLVGLTRWQLLIMSAPMIIGYLLWLLVRTYAGRGRLWAQTKRLLLAGLLAAGLMAPLASPLLIDQFTSESPSDAFIDELAIGRTDLAAYVTPSLHSGLWRDWVTDRYANFTAVNQFYTPYLGFVVLALVAIGVVGRWRRAWPWLLIASLYIVLALGPILAINGESYAAVPMPYRLVQEWFIFRILRRPDRLNVFLSLPVAMTAAYGVLLLLRGAARQKIGGAFAITAVVSLLILLDYAPVPFATTRPIVPAWYEQLAADPEAFAVLDLPIQNRGFDKWAMLYQITHRKPLVTGHVSRLPAEAFDFLDSTPFLRQLRQTNEMDFEMHDISRQLEVLAAAEVRYLVIHKRFAHEGQILSWRDWLSVPPHYEDDEVIVYRTDPAFDEDFDFEQSLVPNLGIVRAAAVTAEAVAGGDVKLDLRWGTAAPPAGNYDVCLRLATAESCRPVAADFPTSTWDANELVRGFYAWRLPENFAQGEHELALFLADSVTGERVGEMAVLQSVSVHPFDPQRHTNARWEQGIELLGYTSEAAAERFELTLFWRAEAPLSASYKVFVHLVDDAGNIVAQHDGVPRGWTYPTTAWSAGEIVRDPIEIDTAALPAGQYAVRVGLYEADTAARLPVAVGFGMSGLEERVDLEVIEIGTQK